MATRILLHGGNSDRDTEKNEKFYTEIIDALGGDVIRVLCVYFARPEHRWEDSYYDDQITFLRLEREMGREIKTKLAKSFESETFLHDISQADVIFINGGMKGHLKQTLLSIGADRFWQALDGKTLVGISAGANVLAKYYYSIAAGEIREGTGFLNCKVLTHYSESEDEQLEALKVYGESLPLITIREEEYVVFEQSKA
jgi:peptidase E